MRLQPTDMSQPHAAHRQASVYQSDINVTCEALTHTVITALHHIACHYAAYRHIQYCKSGVVTVTLLQIYCLRGVKPCH